MKVSLLSALKGTKTCTEFGAIVPGMYLPLISGRIKHIVRHLITAVHFFILKTKEQKV